MKIVFPYHNFLQRKIVVIFVCIFFYAGCATKKLAGNECYARVKTLYRDYKTDFPDIPDITVKELVDIQKAEKVIIVDNRKSEEQKVSMIPGAITNETYLKNIDHYDDDNFVVIYCTIGSRSGFFIKELRKKKINAYNLIGGVLAWAHEGNIFLDSKGEETKQVHVYGSKWDLLPYGYKAVW
jgi:rhodanese-related sulfurtransferase